MTLIDIMSKLCTPDYSHVDANAVYSPAEDSFLFLDALEDDRSWITGLDTVITLEIGSGSGILTAFLASILRGRRALHLMTDVNMAAARASLTTCARTGVDGVFAAVNADLSDGFDHRLAKSVDVLLFNPPYVVTEDSEVGLRGLAASWAGGADGRRVVDLFVPRVDRLLSPSGAFYLLLIEENKPDQLVSWMNDLGFSCETLKIRRASNERQFVLKFTRTK